MNQNRKWLQQMIRKLLAGKATKKEQEFLNAYDDMFIAHSPDPEELSYEELASLENRMEQNIMAIIEQKERKTVRMWPRIAVAVASCAFLVIGGYLLLHDHNKNKVIRQTVSAANIHPGSNTAVLTLANGSQIYLTQQKDGQIAAENGISIVKAKNGLITYAGANSQPNGFVTAAINKVSTPNGGQYQVVLPDGTNVWLNAASSLSFPVSFAGAANREVDLKGEAYFEVSKDKQHPFIVKTATQEVRVLGTHFNINAYSDEPATVTTLLEGSVKVTGRNGGASGTLAPDQQSVFIGAQINIREVIAEDAIAWKEGYFRFNNEPLEEVLKKISRWYNVRIVYKDDNVKTKTAYGTMSRFSNISDVIRLLELTKTARFEIGVNEISVSKY